MEKKLIICPEEEKEKILIEESKQETLTDTKFMTIEEYRKNKFFSYTDKALYYLRKKYGYHLDVAEVYLNHMIAIDLEKKYQNQKLIFLQKLKKELKEEGLLEENPYFDDYLKTRKVEVKGYYDLEKLEEISLGYTQELKDEKITSPVYAFDTIEEEVHFICTEIRRLLKEGIKINHIFLTNVKEYYYYTLDKLFSYYQIPINIPFQNSIYSTKKIADYLSGKEIELDAHPIHKKLMTILGELVEVEDDPKIHRELLIRKLKHTYLERPKQKDAVEIKDIKKYTFQEDDYVFLLGLNQDQFPKMKKDIEYLTDKDKEELELYTTPEQNKREKLIATYLISRIKNITMTYPERTPFQSFYPTSIIKDKNLEVKRIERHDYNLSNTYNKIRLGEMLDNYYTYGEKRKALTTLYQNYKVPYGTYNNTFQNINLETYQKNTQETLKLSYTALNTYNECHFKYYVNNVLHLVPYEETFAAFLGNLFHKILSIYQKENFDFEKEWNAYLETRPITKKEKLLLIKIKKELQTLLKVLKEQSLITAYDKTLKEQFVKIKLENVDNVEFVGYIDKIMIDEKKSTSGKTPFAIVDYKTGGIDTHLEPMKYGLHLQLPIYLYLIKYSTILENPVFTGIYYQNILFSYPKKNTN